MTIFIVVGLLLLIFTVLFFSFQGLLAKKSEIVKGDFIPVQSYIQSCLENTAESAVLFVAKRGGYYDLPADAETKLEMPYYLVKEKNQLITLEKMQQELSDYIEKELPFCLRDFSVLKEKGYLIKAGNPHLSTEISDAKVSFDLSMDTQVSKGEQSVSMSSFTYTVNTRLGTIYRTVQEFIALEEEEPSTTCVSCLFAAITANGVDVSYTALRDNEMMFTITDNEMPINNEVLRYNFINYYDYPKIDFSIFTLNTEDAPNAE